MQSPRLMARSMRLAVPFGVVAVLSGCASNIDRLREATVPTGGTAFTRALASGYRDFTIFEADDMYDWPEAQYFARKGLAARDAEVVLPEDPVNWDLPPDKVPELADARSRLIAALDGGGRDANPAVAARAQAKFDCWVEQQEENHQRGHIAACKKDFEHAMAQLVPTVVDLVPGAYLVLFDFGRSDVNTAGRLVIDQVLAVAVAKGAPVSISVTGHADRSGPEDYNMALSLRRANSVREILIAGGVDPDAITVAGRGESEPTVETSDGVKEQANRSVEILLQ